jgi:hypothetical protein
MKAAGIERFGGDVLELSLPDPRPAGAGETLITVRAAGVAPCCFWDKCLLGGFAGRAPGFRYGEPIQPTAGHS